MVFSPKLQRLWGHGTTVAGGGPARWCSSRRRCCCPSTDACPADPSSRSARKSHGVLKAMGFQYETGWWFGCHQFYCPINIGFLIIRSDELIFFRGVAQPPTRKHLVLLCGFFGCMKKTYLVFAMWFCYGVLLCGFNMVQSDCNAWASKWPRNMIDQTIWGVPSSQTNISEGVWGELSCKKLWLSSLWTCPCLHRCMASIPKNLQSWDDCWEYVQICHTRNSWRYIQYMGQPWMEIDRASSWPWASEIRITSW